MLSFSAQFGITAGAASNAETQSRRTPSPKHTIPCIQGVTQGGRCSSIGSSNSEIGSIFNQTADLHQIEEDGRINGTRAG